MARRATYFFDVHKTKSPRLLVSGGWEFFRPSDDDPNPELMAGLSKAYDFMNYDVGLLSKTGAKHFAKGGIKADTSRKSAEEEPITFVTTSSGDRIAFVRFPTLREGSDIPSNFIVDKTASNIRKARRGTKLVVALSDWGLIGEREYLLRNPQFVPDILLGSGRGSGINGRVEADGRCIWVRPYDKGRTVNEVTINSWPDRSKPINWEPQVTFSSLSIGLGDKYSDHPEVKAILQ